MFWHRFPLAGLLILSGIVLPPQATADLIRLKNGGELRGQIQDSRKRSPAGKPINIRTLSGALVEVNPAEIEFVTRRSLKVERYETRARETADTLEAQWELAEWCRKNRLITQRTTHLQRVVELEPDHERAHRALGHMRHGDGWASREELMAARGYVKYKGRYVSQQELELREQNSAEREAENAWHQKIRLWHGWLDHRSVERQAQGAAKLRAVDDPNAVRSLSQLFAEEEDPSRRALYVQIMSGIPGDKPVGPLVQQSLQDPEKRIRGDALDGLSADQLAAAVPHYLKALGDDANVVVRRAASALKEIGSPQAIPHLIDALVTTHKYKVQVADNASSVSFGKDGSFNLGGGRQTILPPEIAIGLRTGQFPDGVIILEPNIPTRKRVVTVKQTHENQEVKSALVRLTGQDFGYNRRDWTLWWAAQQQAGIQVPGIP